MVHPFAAQLSLGLPDRRTGPDKEILNRKMDSASQYNDSISYGAINYLEMATNARLETQLSRKGVANIDANFFKNYSAPEEKSAPDLKFIPVSNEMRGNIAKNATGSSNQLTVFYGGTVNVYENVPIDKAQAIMSLAKSGQPWPEKEFAGMPMQTVGTHCTVTSLVKGPATPTPQFARVHPATENHRLNMQVDPHALNNLSSDQRFQLPEYCEAQEILVPCQPLVPKALPIARKASLARFLEKRKERLIAPYNVNAKCVVSSQQEIGGVFKGHSSPMLHTGFLTTSGQNNESDTRFYGNAGDHFHNMALRDMNWRTENSRQVSECESTT